MLRHRIWLMFIAAAACLGMLLLLFSMLFSAQAAPPSGQKAAPGSITAQRTILYDSPQRAAPYHAAIWQGQIGLFRQGDSSPFRIISVPISSLPPIDRNALRNGIELGSEAELQAFLEDFES